MLKTNQAPASEEVPNPPANDTPAPQYATVEQLNTINAALNNLTTQLGQFTSRVDVLAEAREAPAPTPPAPTFTRTVTQADIDRAYEEGDVQKAGRLQLTFTQETIKESQQAMQLQLQQLQANGSTMIANVVSEQAKGKLPYYERFKPEIDKMLQKVSPELRANPEMHKWAHDTVVGQNIGVLTTEASEAAIRKALDGGPGYVPGNGTPPKKDGQLTPEGVYGSDWNDVKRLLQSKGISFEEHAKRRGYADAQAYLKHVQKSREEGAHV